MGKKIVTHNNPDLDAVSSCWLLKRFLPGWEEAEIDYCEPKSTIDGKPVDSNPDILHVDVADGKLDHHQTSEKTSAAALVLKFIENEFEEKGMDFKKLDKIALAEIVKVITEIDNARNLVWEEASEIRNDFYLHNLIGGIRGIGKSDEEVMEFSFLALDAILHKVKRAVDAREELKEGIEFETPWGKSIAVETGNDNVLWEGERMGYSLVLKKDDESGNVRIYSRWDRGVDLAKAYEEIKTKDEKADWFLHSSKVLLLNGSKMKKMRPTSLSIKQLIDILGKK